MGVIYSSYEYPQDKSKIVKLEDIPTYPTNKSSDGTVEVSSLTLLYIKLKRPF